MRQKTIKNKVEIVGIGLHKGVPVKMELEPLAPHSGIVFYRSDLGVSIPLKPENVIDTTMATVIPKVEPSTPMALIILESCLIMKKCL